MWSDIYISPEKPWQYYNTLFRPFPETCPGAVISPGGRVSARYNGAGRRCQAATITILLAPGPGAGDLVFLFKTRS